MMNLKKIYLTSLSQKKDVEDQNEKEKKVVSQKEETDVLDNDLDNQLFFKYADDYI